MSHPRLKPDEIEQAQRFVREPPSKWDVLERLDHNEADFPPDDEQPEQGREGR
jgi:hypothetical protein